MSDVDGDTGLITCTFDFCVIIQSKVTMRVLVETLGECEARFCKTPVLGCPPKFPKGCNECHDESGSCS